MSSSDLKKFFHAYVEAALWSTDDGNGESLETNYSASDLSASLNDKMQRDCRAFIEQAEEADLLQDRDDYSQAGHDFWLTRGRYGAGFEDGYWKARGKALADLARKWEEMDLYVSDSGKIRYA